MTSEGLFCGLRELDLNWAVIEGHLTRELARSAGDSPDYLASEAGAIGSRQPQLSNTCKMCAEL